jgi:hypothetical protein
MQTRGADFSCVSKGVSCVNITYRRGGDNNLRGTPRGSRKKPNAGRSPTCRLWMANVNSHMPCHAAPMPRGAVALTSRFKNGMVVAWHGRGMGAAWARRGMCESNTAALCKSNGKDTI